MFWNSPDSYSNEPSDDGYRGVPTDIELHQDISQAKLALDKVDYRLLWDLAHREYLRRQEAGEASVLCEVVGEMVAKHALLTMLRDEWGWNARYWDQVTESIPPCYEVRGKRDPKIGQERSTS